MEIQPCFNNDILTGLADAATTNITEIENQLENRSISIIKNDNTSPNSSKSAEDLALSIENQLSASILENKIEILKDLLKKVQQSIIPSDPHFLSRLFLEVCTDSSLEILEILFSTNLIDCNFSDGINNRTCLHEASSLGILNLLQIAVKNGAKINAVDIYERIPLHYAAMNGKDDCLLFILSSGSSVDVADADGCFPLTYAIAGMF